MEQSGPVTAVSFQGRSHIPSLSARAGRHSDPSRSAWTTGCDLRTRSTGTAGIDREQACPRESGRSRPRRDDGSRCTKSRPGRCRPPAARRPSPVRPRGLGRHSSGGDSSSVHGRGERSARATVGAPPCNAFRGVCNGSPDSWIRVTKSRISVTFLPSNGGVWHPSVLRSAESVQNRAKQIPSAHDAGIWQARWKTVVRRSGEPSINH